MYRRKSQFAVLILILLIIFSLPGLSACKGPPLAVFTASTNYGEAPLLITFTNTSENADEFHWEFGDGDSKITNTVEEIVTHEYTKAREHIVKLTAIYSEKPSETSVMEMTITITHGALAEVTVIPKSVEMNIGDNQEFTTECVDAYGNEIQGCQITWEADSATGSITNGVLTAGTKAGSVQKAITATATMGSSTAEDSASVTINPDPLAAVSIVPIQLVAGENQQFEFIACDEYENFIEGLVPVWFINDESAGSVTEDGIFIAAKLASWYPEAVKVEVTEGDITVEAIADVTVVPGPLAQVALAPEVVDIGFNMTQQMIAAGADRFGNRISGLTFSWSIGDEAGTITEGGLVTAGSNPGDYKDAITVEATQGETTRSASGDINVIPDRILFFSNQGDESKISFDFYIMNADGTNQKLLLEYGKPGIPSCSPDGRRVLTDDDGNIYIFNLDGTWLSILLEGRKAHEPAWSPDGTKIAFQSWEHDPSEIYVMDIDGCNLVQLTDNTYYDDYPRWSPDGQQIVFISERDGDNDIYIMNADGSDQQLLANTPNKELYPQWSPDGAEILFQSHTVGGQNWGIYVMNADGSDIRALRQSSTYSSHLPYWSPDGSKIVFNSNEEGDPEIYIMDRDGSNVVKLTDNTAIDYCAIWLPRMRGVTVTEESVVIPDITFGFPEMNIEVVTAMASDAVVRIETDLGSGSGFIIDADGIILTNNHVIVNAEEITVYLNDGTDYTATVEGRDMVHDIAVLRINAKNLAVLEMAELGSVDLGQQVIVLGYPLGKEKISVTSGLVSTTEFDIGRNIIWVQTDSAINVGNSGGPLLNLQGQVIGIVSAKLIGISVEGLGFAISTNTINTYLSRLLAGETINSFE